MSSLRLNRKKQFLAFYVDIPSFFSSFCGRIVLILLKLIIRYIPLLIRPVNSMIAMLTNLLVLSIGNTFLHNVKMAINKTVDRINLGIVNSVSLYSICISLFKNIKLMVFDTRKPTNVAVIAP